MRAYRRGRLSLGLIGGLLVGAAGWSETRARERAAHESARRNEIAENAEQHIEQTGPARQSARRQVGDAAVTDHELEHASHALLVACREPALVIVARQRACGDVAPPERLHRRLHGELCA